MNDILGKQVNKAPSRIRKDGKIITNPKDLANTFNNIFQDKIRKLRIQTSVNPIIQPAERLKSWMETKTPPPPDFSLENIGTEECLKKD